MPNSAQERLAQAQLDQLRSEQAAEAARQRSIARSQREQDKRDEENDRFWEGAAGHY